MNYKVFAAAMEGKPEEEAKYIADQCYRQFEDFFGRRLRYIVTGGAPTAPEVMYDICLDTSCSFTGFHYA